MGRQYHVGLHNATKLAYSLKSRFDDKYYINSGNVTEKDVVSSILNKGLYVSDRMLGIMSTVTFLDKVTPDSLNYFYWCDLPSNKCYVVIVAVPKYICLYEKKYKLSNVLMQQGIVNYSLFDILLPKELIYGYYAKDIAFISKNDNDVEAIFNENLEFVGNENFYGYMDDSEREEFWVKYFQKYNIDISMLSSSMIPLVKRLVKRK